MMGIALGAALCAIGLIVGFATLGVALKADASDVKIGIFALMLLGCAVMAKMLGG